MTVLHSRNADAADPADVAGAVDVKDPQDAAAEPDLREDLGRYAELGAFTVRADTHAWYAAVDTVATPEDARAASTALAELRGRDLQQTWEAVTALAAEAKLDEPATMAKTALLVEMLQRVHRTSATLTTAAYDADLTALVAATADSSWRRENGVKLSWLRGRSLRKQAVALATDRRVRREDLHEALTSAEIERRAWAALAPAGTLPTVPADGALVDRTAQAIEAINTGLRGLARLLPEHDLDGIAFADLVDLVERLAADEGTLYRLPTIRSLRATLEEAGLGDLIAELTAAKADRRAAEAAYAARQTLAGGQRDGLAESDETGAGESLVEVPEVEASDADAEAAARQALAGGQRDGLAEEAPVSVTAPVEAEASVAETETETEAETEAEAEDGVDAEAVETPSGSHLNSVEVESAAVEDVTEEETPAAVVSLPAPSPAADDLVAAATAALAEAAAADETGAEQAEEPVAEVEAVEEVVKEAADAEPVAEVEAEVVAVEVAEPEVPAVEEPVAEAEVADEAPAVEVGEPAAEVEELTDAAIAEPAEAVEVEVADEGSATEVEEAAAGVEEFVEAGIAEPEAAEVEVEVEVEEPAAEADGAEVAEVAEPVTEAEAAEVPAVEVEEPEVEPEVVAEVPAVEVEEPEVVAEVPAVEAEEPAVEPEVVAEVPAIEAEEPEVVAEVPAIEAEEPEVVAEVPAVVAEVPAVEAEEPAVEPEAVEETPVVEPTAVEPAEAPTGRPEKPDFTPGRPVTAYSADELLAVVRWVDGDGTGRTDEELLRAAMKELGFARLGPRVGGELGAAATAGEGQRSNTKNGPRDARPPRALCCM
ncbi:hypothetical protein [Kitasatospora sp. NPDC056531]|uniref:hypothetical protein n=1 Tax=Kitasatospora sp. NPDC056531 TaxID=3345856 RepID=UPI00369F5433